MTPDNDALLVSELRRDEGVDHFAYQDSLSFWTIGVGRLIDRRKGGGLTDDEVNYLLSNDVKRVYTGLDEKLPWWRDLDPIRRRVLANMAFQLGVNGLVNFKNTLAAVKAKQWDQASAGMLASRWAEQTPERAKRLAQMMKTGAV